MELNSQGMYLRPMSKRRVAPIEMAYNHYDNRWLDVQRELLDIVRIERPFDEPQIFEKRLSAVEQTSLLYLKYVRICNEVTECYNYMVHPQARRYLKRLSESILGRVLELKHELVALEFSDFQYMDQMLFSLGMIPSEMELKTPNYCKEVEEDSQSRKGLMWKCVADKKNEDAYKTAVSEIEKHVRLAMVYLQIIQAHERASEARNIFRDAQKRNCQRELSNQMEKIKEAKYERSRHDYASIIQRTWRKFIFRRKLGEKYTREMEELNEFSSKKAQGDLQFDTEEINATIKRNEEEYKNAKAKRKEEIMIYKAPWMAEDLENKIRDFFEKHFRLYAEYPTYPTEKEGGCLALFACPIEPVKLQVKLVKEEEDDEKDKKGKGKKGKKNKKEKGKKGNKDDDDDEPKGFSLKPSKYLRNVFDLLEEYRAIWSKRIPYSFDRYDSQLMEEEIQREVELVVRTQVDGKMRVEAKKLSEAIRKDLKKKKKKGKKRGKKKGKKKKKKAEKDLTADRSFDSLVKELADNGIIVNYPKVKLDDFWGEYNRNGAIDHQSGDLEFAPLPGLADVKRIAREYCIIPMCSESIHIGGAFVKSVLFIGPRGSGKKTLVYSILTELDATVMDLSAENIQNKYPGKEGLKMLEHLVMKLARLLQPTVILIRDAENYFYKKKPPRCKLAEPGRFKRHLPKLVKKIKNTDRIQVIGISSCPFQSNQKLMSKSFQKTLCLYKPDYNCRSLLWQKFLQKHGGQNITTNVTINTLSSISDGFTGGSIEECIRQTLSARRLASRDIIPLSALDFVPALAECVPVYDEEHKEFRSWMQKTTLGKKRKKLLAAEKEEENQQEQEEAVEIDDYYF